MLAFLPNSLISRQRKSNSIHPHFIFKVQHGTFTAGPILHVCCKMHELVRVPGFNHMIRVST